MLIQTWRNKAPCLIKKDRGGKKQTADKSEL